MSDPIIMTFILVMVIKFIAMLREIVMMAWHFLCQAPLDTRRPQDVEFMHRYIRAGQMNWRIAPAVDAANKALKKQTGKRRGERRD